MLIQDCSSDDICLSTEGVFLSQKGSVQVQQIAEVGLKPQLVAPARTVLDVMLPAALHSTSTVIDTHAKAEAEVDTSMCRSRLEVEAAFQPISGV